jgi:hypothetical protein
MEFLEMLLSHKLLKHDFVWFSKNKKESTLAWPFSASILCCSKKEKHNPL